MSAKNLKIGDERIVWMNIKPGIYVVDKSTGECVELTRTTKVARYERLGYRYPSLQQDPEWRIDRIDYGKHIPEPEPESDLSLVPLKRPWWSWLLPWFWRRQIPEARVVRT